MIPQPGEVWLADTGDEQRRQVYVISESMFHRLGERAIVAPLIAPPAQAYPWHIVSGEQRVAVNLLSSVATGRLLERVKTADSETLRKVRRAAQSLIT